MSILRPKRSGGHVRRSAKRRLGLEFLESRVTPATFKVNTLLDTVAVNLNNGKDANGQISLRSAVMASNAHGGSNTINLPSGAIRLTIPGANEDGSATGDLDIHNNLTIKGKGAGKSTIDGNQLDRVIEVLSGKVSISGVTIQNGRVTGNGGGIFNVGGKVSLSSVTIEENVAIGTNGGASQAGGVAEGGGIFNQAGSLSLTSVSVELNRAIGGNGGNGLAGINVTASGGISGTNGRSAVGGNGGAGGAGGNALGGGIFNQAGASLTASALSMTNNQAIGGSGGTGGAGGFAIGGRGGDDNGGVGFGGDASGGAGGAGGSGGFAEGGGLFNQGIVSLTSKASTFSFNDAFGGGAQVGGSGGTGIGGNGGNGILNDAGGPAGGGFGGAGGRGGEGGEGDGGAIFNDSGASLKSTVAVTISQNIASGNLSGISGNGGTGEGGNGGKGGTIAGGNGGRGGQAQGGNGGFAGDGGRGQGGGLFNQTGATLMFSSPKNVNKGPLITLLSNSATGGGGFDAGVGGRAIGGNGGNGGGVGNGGAGGAAFSGTGGIGGSANHGFGGGLFNAGSASFTGVTLNVTSNKAVSGHGGHGGQGGSVQGGHGGNGVTTSTLVTGGRGGNANGGNGGNGGTGGIGQGGGIDNVSTGTLTIKPRQGAKKGSSQSKATNTITANQALASSGGLAGDVGASQVPGPGGAHNGSFGLLNPGIPGVTELFSVGIGGGLVNLGTATIDNTTITGNTATTNDNDVEGTFNV
jgi:hypothetical protein